MRHLIWLALATGCTESSPPPPVEASAAALEAWAGQHYTLSEPHACATLEQQMFGARSTTCWSAKARMERPAGSRMFTRFEILIADYGSDDGATRRLARFHELPAERGESTKAYPLRAGFRVGQRVVIISTDAYAFADDVDRVAAELVPRMGGNDLMCWRSCAR